jgi:hypothetical protein
MMALAAAAGLTGCATVGSSEAARDTSSAMTCNANPAQRHLGQTASAAAGGAILRDSGARTLRWGPPNSAWTMDYREDRVNVRYDAAMTITGITCG